MQARRATQVSAAIMSLVFGLLLVSGCTPGGPLISIPATAELSGVPSFIGQPAVANPLPIHTVPINPYLLDGRNGIHYDTCNSDVTNWVGPLGNNPSVATHKLDFIAKSCPTILFDSQGRLITVSISFFGTNLYLIDPLTLEILAKHPLPPKTNINIGGENDSSGGGYIHMTPSGQVIIPKMDKRIGFYELVENAGEPSWILVKDIDLSGTLPEDAYLQDTVPDYDGRIWFTTSIGILGYVNDEITGEVTTYTVEEGMQNQPAIDPTGLYVVTHGYMNKFSVDDITGDIILVWRTEYDNSAGQTGLLAPGSGTSPTLFGENENYVTIADNAYPTMHLNVYDRTTGAEICSQPVFEGSEGVGCENSLIGYGNDAVIENNGGFAGFFGDPQLTNEGLAKVHVLADQSGCELVWENYDLKASTTPALSTATGLIYSYSVKQGMDPEGNDTDAWFLSTVDWETGATVYEAWVGSGKEFADILQPVVIGPDAFYIGTRNGILAVRDD
jgi:hypothetical protein